jgi:hypothetical protein
MGLAPVQTNPLPLNDLTLKHDSPVQTHKVEEGTLPSNDQIKKQDSFEWAAALICPVLALINKGADKLGEAVRQDIGVMVARFASLASLVMPPHHLVAQQNKIVEDHNPEKKTGLTA